MTSQIFMVDVISCFVMLDERTNERMNERTRKNRCIQSIFFCKRALWSEKEGSKGTRTDRAHLPSFPSFVPSTFIIEHSCSIVVHWAGKKQGRGRKEVFAHRLSLWCVFTVFSRSVTFFRVYPNRSKAFPPRERERESNRERREQNKKNLEWKGRRSARSAGLLLLVMLLGLCACVCMVWREGREDRNGREWERDWERTENKQITRRILGVNHA